MKNSANCILSKISQEIDNEEIYQVKLESLKDISSSIYRIINRYSFFFNQLAIIN